MFILKSELITWNLRLDLRAIIPHTLSRNHFKLRLLIHVLKLLLLLILILHSINLWAPVPSTIQLISLHGLIHIMESVGQYSIAFRVVFQV